VSVESAFSSTHFPDAGVGGLENLLPVVARLWDSLVRLAWTAARNDQADVEIRSFGNIHRWHLQRIYFSRGFLEL